jgi:predicted RNase H-like nuclease (RuvC/YqgF family)
MTGTQLRLFHEPRSDLEELNDEFETMMKRVDNFRKSFFQKMSTMSTEIRTLQSQCDILQAQMFVQEKCMKMLIEKIEKIEREYANN